MVLGTDFSIELAVPDANYHGHPCAPHAAPTHEPFHLRAAMDMPTPWPAFDQAT
jgi:hypothetical protein